MWGTDTAAGGGGAPQSVTSVIGEHTSTEAASSAGHHAVQAGAGAAPCGPRGRPGHGHRVSPLELCHVLLYCAICLDAER